MHRLPLELTSQIFELALPTQDGWGRTRPSGKSRTYFSSICKGWRDIAWSIPSLWSTMAIELGTSSTSDPGWLNSVYDWILRSRTLPLTLHIKVPKTHTRNDDSEDESNDQFEDQFSNLLAVMSKRPNEWQSLSLFIPSSFLHIFHNIVSDFQFHIPTVKKLRIRCTDNWNDANQQVLPSNPVINPERIDICGFSFQSLQISWNHLTSAKVELWTLGGITQLFLHAPQMTYCSISLPRRHVNVVIPPIVHRRLQKLILGSGPHSERELSMILDSLTLPCLRIIQTDFRVTVKIPALMDRSSCPLTRITIRGCNGIELLPHLRPLPGVTDLSLPEDLANYSSSLVEKLLFTPAYFPDLRHLTLPPPVFFGLWYAGTIPKLLGSRPDAPNQITLRTILVRGVDKSYSRWTSEGRRQLEVFQSCIRWREDGLEILIPA